MLRTLVVFLVASVFFGCGPSTSRPEPPDAEVTAEASAPADYLESGAPGDPLDAAFRDAQHGEASVTCAPLGAACESSAECLCGLGAGCEWDNVVCVGLDAGDAGRCTIEYLPVLDAGDVCCSACEIAYDTCDGSPACGSAWTVCNAACGEGQCPVRCLAEDRP